MKLYKGCEIEKKDIGYFTSVNGCSISSPLLKDLKNKIDFVIQRKSEQVEWNKVDEPSYYFIEENCEFNIYLYLEKIKTVTKREEAIKIVKELNDKWFERNI